MGTDPKLAAHVTRICKEAAEKPVYVKLSPNVTNIVRDAESSRRSWSRWYRYDQYDDGDALGFKNRKRSECDRRISGPAIKPVAIRMVYRLTSYKIFLSLVLEELLL